MSRLRRIASRIDDGLDLARMHMRRLIGRDDPVTVQVHAGFGTTSRLHVSGLVMKAAEPDERPARLAVLRDIRATLDRYIERGVMGARLTVRHGEDSVGSRSDSDGFFHAELPCDLPPEDRVAWREVHVRLEDFPGSRQPPADFAGEVMVPPAAAAFGIISDMDDTVLKTGIHDFRRNWRQVIRSDPALREAFPGLAELYRGLTHDRQGVQRNPVFYISSAACGFHELFMKFLELREIPMGPLLLKNYGLDEDKWFSGGHSLHKTRATERLFATYPAMRFIMVGDSGQHDAKIYREVVDRHPGRVLAVWIRDVTPAPDRKAEIEALIAELDDADVPAAFGPDLLVAARQAAAEGWMPEEAVSWVEAAVEVAAARGAA